jgi:hypothetical protein
LIHPFPRVATHFLKPWMDLAIGKCRFTLSRQLRRHEWHSL